MRPEVFTVFSSFGTAFRQMEQEPTDCRRIDEPYNLWLSVSTEATRTDCKKGKNTLSGVLITFNYT
jgi:hypothetical protein